MKLSFLGGAKMVTGANYLLETKKAKILVDCGLLQGSRFCEKQNYEPFGFDPKTIDYLFVTHAHIDHIGRIPKLVKDGFQGKIFATPPTCDFAKIMFEDSLGLMEEELERKSNHLLFSEEDLARTLKLFKKIDYGKKIELDKGVSVCFREAGHVLGSAFIELWAEKHKIVFSGDLGNPPVPLLKSPELVREADWLLVESTYGDRLHEAESKRKDILEDAIEDTVSRKGVLMIPAFALERTQELLYEMNELVENERVPAAPVFIDSPLAIKATRIYNKYPQYYNKEATYLIASGDELFKFPGLKFTPTTAESKRINEISPPKIIIAGSGMSTGGRILHHEKKYLTDENSMLLIISYQVVGSLGRRILEGATEVSIHGEKVPVKARIRAIGGYSAHADQEQLISWISPMRRKLKRIFVVQGEEGPSITLALKIRDHLGVDSTVPEPGEIVEL